jgi:hypothetical protein
MNKKTNRFRSLIALCRANSLSIALVSAVFLSCGPRASLTGTSSGVETKIARGIMVDDQKINSAYTEVMLVPSDYNPGTEKPLPNNFIEITDTNGRYSFHNIDTGAYNVLATKDLNGTMALQYTVHLNADSVDIFTDTLRKPGAIDITLPNGAQAVQGYVYIPGTPIISFFNGNKDSLVLAMVPAGTILSVCYSELSSKVTKVIRYDVPVHSGDTTAIANPDWTHSKRLYLNTTPSGANVPGNVFGFPVLIRFTRDNFNFSEAQTNGGDLRFTKADNTPLSFEIERWDPVAGLAEVWIKVDTIYGNDDSHGIVMYWGTSTGSLHGSGTLAATSSNGAAVFDTSIGFQGVWHMNGPDAAQVKDATSNGFNGVPYNMPAGSVVNGAIGTGRLFRGDSCYITMPGTAASKLNFPESGVYSLSAWVYADTLDSLYQTIISKGDEQYNLEILDSAWEFAEYENKAGWAMSQSPTSIMPHQWVHITGVRNQTGQYLFVNGQCVDSVITMLGNGFSRGAGYDLMIGKTNGVLMPGFPYYFHGIIDEIRISNRALGPDWIKLCYMNQKQPDALIVW